MRKCYIISITEQVKMQCIILFIYKTLKRPVLFWKKQITYTRKAATEEIEKFVQNYPQETLGQAVLQSVLSNSKVADYSHAS